MTQTCPCPHAVVRLGWASCRYSARHPGPPNSSPLLYSGPLKGKFLHFHSSSFFSSRIPFKPHLRRYTDYFWVWDLRYFVTFFGYFLLELLQSSSVIFFFFNHCPSCHLLCEAFPSPSPPENRVLAFCVSRPGMVVHLGCWDSI